MQLETYHFGVDSLVFITADKKVYGIDDPTQASLDLQYEIAEKRGGVSNDLRATAIHTRAGKVTISTGKADIELVNLLTGGTITSIGATIASVTTQCTTLYGTTVSIPTEIISTSVNSTAQVRTRDYYLQGTDFDKVQVTRTSDGKVFGPYTLTAGASIVVSSEGITLWAHATDVGSIDSTGVEVAQIVTRAQINSFNQVIDINSVEPETLSCRIEGDFDGTKTIIEIPNIQPKGFLQQMSATEFSIQDMEMPIYNSQTLDRLARISKQS